MTLLTPGQTRPPDFSPFLLFLSIRRYHFTRAPYSTTAFPTIWSETEELYTPKLKKFAKALSEALFFIWYLSFCRIFFFFKSHKSCLSFRPHKIWCHHALSTLPNSIALRCFPFSHHLPEAFLLPCRRQVAIIPSGDENSHCSPLSYSNNIICLIKRWQRKREWEPTSWVVKDSLPLALSYFLFSTHYFGFIKFIATW